LDSLSWQGVLQAQTLQMLQTRLLETLQPLQTQDAHMFLHMPNFLYKVFILYAFMSLLFRIVSATRGTSIVRNSHQLLQTKISLISVMQTTDSKPPL
jgi:hypothetical protein